MPTVAWSPDNRQRYGVCRDRHRPVGCSQSPRTRVAVTLNRPNAISFLLVNQLHAALDVVQQENTCRVVIATVAGRGFCSGLDLSQVGGSSAWSRTIGPDESAVSRSSIVDCHRPGGGVTLSHDRGGVGAQSQKGAFNEEGGNPQHAGPVADILVVEGCVHHAGHDVAGDGGRTEGRDREPQPSPRQVGIDQAGTDDGRADDEGDEGPTEQRSRLKRRDQLRWFLSRCASFSSLVDTAPGYNRLCARDGCRLAARSSTGSKQNPGYDSGGVVG